MKRLFFGASLVFAGMWLTFKYPEYLKTAPEWYFQRVSIIPPQYWRDVAGTLGLILTIIGVITLLTLFVDPGANKQFNVKHRLPYIERCFNGQEFNIRTVWDKKDYWLLFGDITPAPSIPGLTSVYFCIPKSTTRYKLGFYGEGDYLLVDITQTKGAYTKGYLMNTYEIRYKHVPLPR